MNNAFLLLFCISFLCIPFFILWALINLIRKKPAKKRFIFAGISAIVLIISLIGFGLTMGDAAPDSPANVANKVPAATAESTTPKPEDTSTTQPADTAIVQPADEPADIATAQPTEKSTEVSNDIPSPSSDAKTFSDETEASTEDVFDFNVMFSDSYRNDVTGNWRLARIAENINIEEYAVEYYNNYFESDDEIHIIINFTLNTTTKIAVMGNLLDVSIMEYVDGEEHDAKVACSGTLLNEYHINIDNGKIEDINADSSEVTSLDARETESEKQADSTPIDSATQPVIENNSQAGETTAGKSSPVPESDTIQTSTDSIQPADNTSSKNGSNSDGSNFNTYDNQSQQQTSDTYVLNTSTHKIHYPHCSSVPKIAPQNYATSNSSVDELKSQGYTTCGKCF